MDALLQVNSLTKKFGPIAALEGINLSISRGRIVGLLGPNGSGKTTLIKIANGLLTPTSGTVTINGEEPGVKTKAQVSYLPDHTYFDEWMKVRDCISLFSDFYVDFDKAKAYEMLNTLGIDPSAAFKRLSKGTKEKVQIVLVMSRNAELYLLDEPIGGVDPAARDYILNTIISNYNENGTVIISTHLIHDIENVLDDVIFLGEGRIRLISGVEELRAKEHKSVDEVFREVFRC